MEAEDLKCLERLLAELAGDERILNRLSLVEKGALTSALSVVHSLRLDRAECIVERDSTK
jgi:hypothetical protein